MNSSDESDDEKKSPKYNYSREASPTPEFSVDSLYFSDSNNSSTSSSSDSSSSSSSESESESDSVLTGLFGIVAKSVISEDDEITNKSENDNFETSRKESPEEPNISNETENLINNQDSFFYANNYENLKENENNIENENSFENHIEKKSYGEKLIKDKIDVNLSFGAKEKYENNIFLSIIEEADDEWAISLYKNLIEFNNNCNFTMLYENKNCNESSNKKKTSSELEILKFKPISEKSSKMTRNLQNKIKIEQSMGEETITDNIVSLDFQISLEKSQKNVKKRKIPH
ncbi:hypothetical protein TRFO_03887 [Tritrichomonas foetus]|uniref:Uncharacterized protein n=1 Tax=Tritrichomonas foetus TaxID=1144522 RepID=A0A1J4KK41_9EUKA|nr:hypothetical protein TRFO_03887 [Tritrichomonas foetus]|eukprot:OHT11665.1 hypothetical protein TRFO_03887 [Tritrichomonas foetus]